MQDREASPGLLVVVPEGVRASSGFEGRYGPSTASHRSHNCGKENGLMVYCASGTGWTLRGRWARLARCTRPFPLQIENARRRKRK